MGKEVLSWLAAWKETPPPSPRVVHAPSKHPTSWNLQLSRNHCKFVHNLLVAAIQKYTTFWGARSNHRKVQDRIVHTVEEWWNAALAGPFTPHRESREIIGNYFATPLPLSVKLFWIRHHPSLTRSTRLIQNFFLSFKHCLFFIQNCLARILCTHVDDILPNFWG